jgi:Ca2+-binding RTX toxin-like protein
MRRRVTHVPALATAVVLLAGTALTATSTVATSRVDAVKTAVTVNTIKPTQCASLTLSRILTGAGTIDDTSAASLILGSAAVDSITGRGGNDCIDGGGASDTINGGAGTDVCIGGPGSDVFVSCESTYQ